MTDETIDLREPIELEGHKVTPYDIDPLEPQKRLRVLGGWLIEAVFDGINMFNHAIRLNAWMHRAQHLQIKYPIHEKYIQEIVLEVWARYQKVWKTEIEPSIKQYKKV